MTRGEAGATAPGKQADVTVAGEVASAGTRLIIGDGYEKAGTLTIGGVSLDILGCPEHHGATCRWECGSTNGFGRRQLHTTTVHEARGNSKMPRQQILIKKSKSTRRHHASNVQPNMQPHGKKKHEAKRQNARPKRIRTTRDNRFFTPLAAAITWR